MAAQWKDAKKKYVQRAGGSQTALRAVIVGATVSTLALKDLPYVPAALVGAAGAGYAVQLPQKNKIGKAARSIGSSVPWAWKQISDMGDSKPRRRR
mmetsp:Transcript_16354/g.37720  ORF Transcript_16354/g.37720 Transcript_16354/m.37720 type:complete len:96 (+) Transcript_16354:175-462(+)